MRTIDNYKAHDGTIDETTTVTLPNLDQYFNWSAQIVSTNQSSANYSMQVQISNDNSNWVDSGSPTVINSNTSFFIEKTEITYKYARLVFTKTGGSFDCLVVIQARG